MRDLTIHDQQVGHATAQAEELQRPQLPIERVVVGDIPLEPPGYQLRPSLLAKLDRAGARITVLEAATRLQGVGATQLAAAYARAKVAAGWRLVAWVNGADAGSLQAGMAAVSDATGLINGESGDGVADASLVVREWLETDGDRCLLVLDDVSDPELLWSFVPSHGMARVLITGSGATRPAASLHGARVLVDVFSADEAVSFLTRRTGLADEAGAAAVAALLGHLPLALALAAPMISGQRNGYARYLDRLHMTPTEVHLTAQNGEAYPHGVARAVLLPLAAIRTADKTGMCARIMAIMSVLSATGVPRELLHVAGRAGLLANEGRRVEAAMVNQALEFLSDRSLLTFSLDGQTVIMHRLVTQAVAQGLIRQRRLGAVCWVAASVLEAHAIAVAGSQDRSAVRRIPQQVAALDRTAQLAGEVDEELAEVLLRLRFIALFHLIELGDSATQAIAAGEPLTRHLERLLGTDHPDTLNARNSLAASYIAARRAFDAIPLLEQNLVVLQRELEPGHPDILTSQNNLASAYQDAGRVGDAIQLYELNLVAREQELGADHPSTLTSRGNLAAAYLAARRFKAAVPLLEQTLADRERVLGPDHPDTRQSRKNLAKAYHAVGRAGDAIPLLEKALADRLRALRLDHHQTQTPNNKTAPAYRGAGRTARAVSRAELTFPGRESRAADTATKGFSLGFRRPRADPARRLPADLLASPSARRASRSAASRAREKSQKLGAADRRVLAAISAGDPAGIAMAYDMYAADLYGYCSWRLHDSKAAAESLRDTFVVAAATLSSLQKPARLRPLLFALARSECRRRRPRRVTRDGEPDAGNLLADAGAGADGGGPADATHRLGDVTTPFPEVTGPASESYGPNDVTMQFSIVGEPADATIPIPVVSRLADVTMPFRVVSGAADGTDGLAFINDYMDQAEVRELIRSILADLNPREREGVELSLRHELDENDLAIVLGVSRRRARALVARAHGRLENAFYALRTALAGRDACPVVGELLADWDGQLTEQTRDLVAWHIEQCQTCVSHGQGTLRPTALLGLLPLVPLPPELRQHILSSCSATDETAVAYRRRVVRRAESIWLSRFSTATRWLSWDALRTSPGPAVATVAVALWVGAAVTVTLLTFAGSVAARAQAHQPPAGSSSGHSATERTQGSPAAKTRPSPTGSPAARQSSAPYSPVTSGSSSPAHSVQPSAAPSATPSPSPSPSPTPTPSPSPSPTPSSSQSS